jgi:hypothetical protein
MTKALLIAALLAAPAAAAQTPAPWSSEPAAYRGVPWGASTADLKAKKLNVEKPITLKNGKVAVIGSLTVGTVSVEEAWTFVADKLVSVYWRFPAGDFDKLAVTLTEKYGQAHSTENKTLQNAVGATFQNVTYSWNGAKVSIWISKYGSNVTKGSATFVLNEYMTAKSREDQDAQKKAKDAF